MWKYSPLREACNLDKKQSSSLLGASDHYTTALAMNECPCFTDLSHLLRCDHTRASLCQNTRTETKGSPTQNCFIFRSTVRLEKAIIPFKQGPRCDREWSSQDAPLLIPVCLVLVRAPVARMGASFFEWDS
jgi:hypothetical protein